MAVDSRSSARRRQAAPSRIQLPFMPEDAVPYTVEPDSMMRAAGLGFGGTQSTARMDAYAQQLMERGYSESEAKELAYLEEKQAWADRAENGLRSRGPATNVEANLEASASPILPDPEPYSAREPRYKAADARMDRFEADYNAATGHPEYGYDEAGNPAMLGRVDIDKPSEKELRDAGARRFKWRAPYNSEVEYENYGPGSDYAPEAASPVYTDTTVPGPRTLDGKSPTPSRGLTAEEAEAYNSRAEGQLSQRDKDMMARGYVPVVTPDGVAYQPAYVANRNKYAIPGGPGRPGPRTGLEKPYLDGKYELGVAVGPDGVPRSVYTPTAQFREDQKTKLAERRAALAADRNTRRDRWQAMAMLAGGSQNLNSGNRWIASALVDMKPEDRERAMRYMLPGGNLHAAVDAQNMQNANEVIKRFMTSGAAAGLNNPATAAAVQQQQLQQQQEMVKWAEDNINNNYAWDSDTWLPGSDFTEQERGQAIQDLMDRYGPPAGNLTLAEATRIVDNIGQRKPKPRTLPPAGATAPSAEGADGGFTG